MARSGDEHLRLLLIRHADAGDPAEWTGPDAERPLSERGIKQAARLAAALHASGASIDRLIASPARRCGETAAILGEVLGLEVSVEQALADGPRLAELRRIVDDGSSCVALVGHEPHLSALAGELTGIAGIPVPKGTMVRIDLPRPLAAGGGTLAWVAPPSLFRSPKGER
ncbi:MAG: hypothetical protein RLZZ432_131 [Chloroflexota bacterium]